MMCALIRVDKLELAGAEGSYEMNEKVQCAVPLLVCKIR